MKIWNAPVIEELDVMLTAGGRWDSEKERGAAWNDSDLFKCPQTDEEDS